jgi:ribosomal protein L11 methyltransferase
MAGQHEAAAARECAWLVLSAPVPPAGEALLMVDGLRRLGVRAVEREGERVVAWLPPPADVGEFVADASAVIRASTSMSDPDIAWHWASHEQWTARWVHAVEPRRVTDRIVVAPIAHEVGLGDVDERDHGDVVIRLEAGSAFGTADHATTRGCLRMLDDILRAGDHVVDIGTGSGVLAIAAALLGARDVQALEADALSCEDARRNVRANGVADRVTVRERTVGPADLRSLPRCDVVIANLEAGTITALLPGLRAALAPRGSLIVSGMTSGEREALLTAADAAGLVVEAQADADGWLSVRFATLPAPTL